ncbi:MAG: transposase, partial [Coleofasciculus sp. S288]|nr:transposase [Coleofasciculus sp. S288]
WVKSLPGHQLQEAVADALDAHKQALFNGGNAARFKSCRKPSQVVKFKVGNFRSGTWYPTKVKDLHSKTTRFLVDNYKVIFLPTFGTSEMVVKSKRKLKKKTARNMLTWSHFKFKQHLLQMAEREGVLVIQCNESYTSRTCPECGHIHFALGGNKKFQCPKCGYTAHRDWNGARNIMVRALQATAFTVIGDAIQVGICY